MVSDYVFTMHDRVNDTAKSDSVCRNSALLLSFRNTFTRRCLKLLSQIAVGDYNVDAHVAQRILLPDGTVTNEGCLSGWGNYAHIHLGGFDIPWRVMLPPKRQASNLLVSAAVSASHVGCGPLRLEPQYMNLGHAAGVAANLLATRPNVYRTMHDIPVTTLQAFLQQQGVQIHAKQSSAGGNGFRCVLQVRNNAHSLLWQKLHSRPKMYPMTTVPGTRLAES